MHLFLTSSLSPSHFVPLYFVSFMGGALLACLAPLPFGLLILFSSLPGRGLSAFGTYVGLYSFISEREEKKNLYLESLAPGHVSR